MKKVNDKELMLSWRMVYVVFLSYSAYDLHTRLSEPFSISHGSLYLQAGLCKFSELWHLYQLYFVFLHGIMLCILLLKYCRKPIND